ncbi:putative signal transducing protein [Halocola ammonii]
MPLITIKTFETPIEAHLLKVKFESEGVPCYLFDEEIVQLNPIYNVATGGVKLKVHEGDLQKA